MLQEADRAHRVAELRTRLDLAVHVREVLETVQADVVELLPLIVGEESWRGEDDHMGDQSQRDKPQRRDDGMALHEIANPR